MELRPIDADGNFGTRGAELLEQPPVRADPQIFLCYFHLEQETKGFAVSLVSLSTALILMISFMLFCGTHGAEVPRSWSCVEPQQQPCDKDHVVLHKRLTEIQKKISCDFSDFITAKKKADINKLSI